MLHMAEPSRARLVYPHMLPAERADFCRNAPWWTAPVVVGGSGGSGTRGSVLLLQRLGVGMACEDPMFEPSVLDPAEHCNKAKDFDLMGGKRQRTPLLVWLTTMRQNLSTCEVDDGAVTSLLHDLEATPAEKGFSPARLMALRAGVRPAYRQALRWGMKNPHATYMLKLMLRYFPCMVYVHTVRGLPEMVRNMDHIESRIGEAATYGLLRPEVARGGRDVRQVWLAGYLAKVNGGLVTWAASCMPPPQLVYLNTMKCDRTRVVASGPMGGPMKIPSPTRGGSQSSPCIQ